MVYKSIVDNLVELNSSHPNLVHSILDALHIEYGRELPAYMPLSKNTIPCLTSSICTGQAAQDTFI